MERLFNIIAELSFELSPERMELLAEKISRLENVTQMDTLRSAWGTNINKVLYQKFIVELEKYHSMTGGELSMAFRSAMTVVQFSESKGRQELIRTGPATTAVAVRQTEQALCEVIQSAIKTLFIVSFVAYKADTVLAALTEALERNVEINFLLENSKDHGGTVDIDSIATLREKFPTSNFYVWNNAQNPASASVHAKCAVADKTMALITSANLTGKAMNSNMELGVLIRNGILPKQLFEHLNRLITEKIIIPVRA